MQRVITGIAAAVAAALATFTCAFSLGPALRQRRGAAEWTDIGPTTDFNPGTPEMVSWTEEQTDGFITREVDRVVWAYTPDGKKFTVWNPKCTHLGCLTYFDERARTINSPCHDGIFALDGRVIGGPPPRPLDELPRTVENGRLFAIYKDFQLGIPEKVEL